MAEDETKKKKRKTTEDMLEVNEQADSTSETPLSALLQLDYFDIVADVPIETMHLYWQLVCKHYLDEIMFVLRRGFGVLKNKRISKRIHYLNSRIKAIGKLCPSEFDRKLSSTEFIHTAWKASSYRQFFMYAALPLLEDLLDEDWWEHLTCFVCVLHLIGGADPDPVPEEDLNVAERLVKWWVGRFIALSNGAGWKPCMHFFLHAVEDLRYHKCHGDVLSSFPYENALGRLKSDIISGSFKLEQLRGRLLERSKVLINRNSDGSFILRPDKTFSIGFGEVCPSLFGKVREPSYVKEKRKYQKITTEKFEFSTKMCDSFVLIYEDRNGKKVPVILRVVDVVAPNETGARGALCVRGHVYSCVEPYLKKPLNSSRTHVYTFSKPFSQTCVFPVAQIFGKLYSVPRFGKMDAEFQGDIPAGTLGEQFEAVQEWVGTLLKHAVATRAASLY